MPGRDVERHPLSSRKEPLFKGKCRLNAEKSRKNVLAVVSFFYVADSLPRRSASSREDLRPHGERRLVVLEFLVPVQPRLQPGNPQPEEDLQ